MPRRDAMIVAVLGFGPHGKQIHALLNEDGAGIPFDDNLPGYQSCITGARRYPYVIGASLPKVRRAINDKVGGVAYLDGRVIFPNVFIGYDAQIGEHVHVLPGAVISHGCQVGDFVTICANATLNGEVTVESGAFIGSGAQIRHGGITIGRNAVVGMGAVVVDDVPDNTKVVGNPARVLVTT